MSLCEHVFTGDIRFLIRGDFHCKIIANTVTTNVTSVTVPVSPRLSHLSVLSQYLSHLMDTGRVDASWIKHLR